MPPHRAQVQSGHVGWMKPQSSHRMALLGMTRSFRVGSGSPTTARCAGLPSKRGLAKVTTYRIQFGEQVREIRLGRGLSQEELADRAGVHRTYLGGIERGERNPSLKNILALARALEVPPARLFEGF